MGWGCFAKGGGGRIGERGEATALVSTSTRSSHAIGAVGEARFSRANGASTASPAGGGGSTTKYMGWGCFAKGGGGRIGAVGEATALVSTSTRSSHSWSAAPAYGE